MVLRYVRALWFVCADLRCCVSYGGEPTAWLRIYFAAKTCYCSSVCTYTAAGLAGLYLLVPSFFSRASSDRDFSRITVLSSGA